MLTIETKETKISDELKRKIEMIERFINTTPLIINGSVLNIKGTNIVYVKPHTVMIKERLYFFFEECDEVFIIRFITQEILFEKSLNQRLEFICPF